MSEEEEEEGKRIGVVVILGFVVVYRAVMGEVLERMSNCGEGLVEC